MAANSSGEQQWQVAIPQEAGGIPPDQQRLIEAGEAQRPFIAAVVAVAAVAAVAATVDTTALLWQLGRRRSFLQLAP